MRVSIGIGTIALALLGSAYAGTTGAATLYGADLDTTRTPNLAILDINPLTGAATSIGSSASPSQLDGLAFDSNTGTLYGTDTVSNGLYKVDTSTGAATFVATLSISPNGSTGLAFDINSNRLFMTWDSINSALYSIDPLTGATTAIGGGLGVSIEALGYDPFHAILYGIAQDANLYQISTSTGAATLIGALGVAWGFPSTFGADYDASNDTLYAVNSFGDNDRLFTVNTSTGEATLVGSLGFGGVAALGIDSGMTAVPLASTLPLLGSALGFFGLFRRRGNRQLATAI